MKPLNLLKKYCLDVPYLTICLAIAMCIAFKIAPIGSELFQSYSLSTDSNRNILSFFAAHLLHTNFNHLFWNVLVLTLCGIVLENKSRSLFLFSWLTGSAAVSLWFYLQSDFSRYVGASGALNAIFAAALLSIIWTGRSKAPKTIALGVAFLQLCKNFLELWRGESLFTDAAWSPTPAAHLIGMFCGFMVSAIFQLLFQYRKNKVA